MAIDKKLIHFNSDANFKNHISEIPNTSIAFVGDHTSNTGLKLYTHGETFDIQKHKVFPIIEDNISVITDDTKGVSPYNTSYGMTYINATIPEITEYYDGLIIHPLIDSKMIVSSDNRNLAININSLGNVPVYGSKDIILEANNYFVKTSNCSYIYKKTINSTGAFHLIYNNDDIVDEYNNLLARMKVVEDKLNIEPSGTYPIIEQAELLSSNWKFELVSNVSDTTYTSTAEAATDYDDSSWTSINIPYDWSIHTDFNYQCPGGSDAGFLYGGDAWYRVPLNITSKMEGKKIYVYFDGVYMESDVYINGTKVNTNKFGYNPFYIDITDYVTIDGTNIMAVFVRSQQPNSRFYSGAGIIRDVALLVGRESNVAIKNIIVTTPNLSTNLTDVETTIGFPIISHIDDTVICKIDILDSTNNIVGSSSESMTIEKDNNYYYTKTITVKSPNLWSIGNGNMYKAKVSINIDGNILYKTADFGYRWFTFDATNGFSLNGENMKLKGVCLHEDLGCLGNAWNESGWEYRLWHLQEMGINAVRTCHSTFPNAFYKMCDEMGILVFYDLFDEWNVTKSGIIAETYGFSRYFDSYFESVLENIMSRDVNHPSIFAWNAGNEVIKGYYDSAQTTAEAILQNIINVIREYDEYRPITMGDNGPGDTVPLALMDELDIEGVNYGSVTEYASVRNHDSNKFIFGAETTSAVSSRGIYEKDDTNHQCSSFDNQVVSWAEGSSAAEILKRHMEDISYLGGLFVWTGYDYIGEPTPYRYESEATTTEPDVLSKSSYFGIIDMCGFNKDIFYMYQSRWTSTPMIHILGDWEYDTNKAGYRDIWLYSNCDYVELFLNGKSLGKSDKSAIGDKYNFKYSVYYTPGTLVANGYASDGTTVVAQDVVYSSQEEVTQVYCYSEQEQIKSDDYAFIECNLVDKNGVLVRKASDEITFTANNGTIVGTDNGDSTCTLNMQAITKPAFNGKILAVVSPTEAGEVSVTTNFNTTIKESITCGSNRLYRTRTTEFIDASKPTIYSYDFSGGGGGSNKVDLGYTTSMAAGDDPETGYDWNTMLTATGYNTYIASAAGTGTHIGYINAINNVEGDVYAIQMTSTTDDYSSVRFTVVEMNSEHTVIDTISNIEIGEYFSLCPNTKYLMINFVYDYTTLGDAAFDNAETHLLVRYPDFEYPEVTKLEWNTEKLSIPSSLMTETISVFDYLTYEPGTARPTAKHLVSFSSSNESVVTITNSRFNFVGLGTSTITATYGTGTSQLKTTMEIEVYEGAGYSWDGTSATLPTGMSMTSFLIVANTTGYGNTYMAESTSTTGELYISQSGSGNCTAELEVYIDTLATTLTGWPIGLEVAAGSNYGACLYTNTSDNATAYFIRNSSNTISLAESTKYTFKIVISGSGSGSTGSLYVTGGDYTTETEVFSDITLTTAGSPTQCARFWSIFDGFKVLSFKYYENSTTA